MKLDDVYEVARGLYYAKKILKLGRKGIAAIPAPGELVQDDDQA